MLSRFSPPAGYTPRLDAIGVVFVALVALALLQWGVPALLHYAPSPAPKPAEVADAG